MLEGVRAWPYAWDGVGTGADWLFGDGADGRKAISYPPAPANRLLANELRKHDQDNASPPPQPRIIGFTAV